MDVYSSTNITHNGCIFIQKCHFDISFSRNITHKNIYLSLNFTWDISSSKDILDHNESPFTNLQYVSLSLTRTYLHLKSSLTGMYLHPSPELSRMYLETKTTLYAKGCLCFCSVLAALLIGLCPLSRPRKLSLTTLTAFYFLQNT